ncbi:hypothetical protein ABIC71_003058 [Herbaspirillum seropedicae]|uniref:hypothetical protein n=1 Tax=Herbaspirillum seropedicae TaxID=964 RepID=UPI003390D9EF
MSYETGVGVAFLAWVFITVSAVVSLNSRMQRNLRKVGMRLSWLTMTPKPIAQDEACYSATKVGLKFILLYGTGLPFVLGSWLYVLYVASLLIYRKNKDFGAPQSVREFRWKLRNTDMSFDQIVKEMVKTNDLPPEDFEKVKSELIFDMQQRGLHPGH